MHIFLDSFHQGGKYYAQIASHQAELGGKNIKDFVKIPLGIFCMPTLMYMEER